MLQQATDNAISYLSLFLFALALGFISAIPVGGSQIEMAKRAIVGNARAAGMVILGSVSSDIVYGVAAIYGLARFMEAPKVLASFHALSAVVLWILAFFSFKESTSPHALDAGRPSLRSGRWAFATGFTLSFSNPQMMLSWLLGVALAKRLGLASPFPESAKAVFIAGGALGLAGYLVVLGAVLHRIKHFIPEKVLRRTYFVLGLVLIALSVYFVHGVVVYLMTGA